MGLFPNEMAWPRKGMLEGIYGGYFCRKNQSECIQAILAQRILLSFLYLTYRILDTWLAE